jgi:predicted P-loop ATPase
MQTRGVWIIEIAELDSMSKAEVGKIKAFMSRAADPVRLMGSGSSKARASAYSPGP